MNQRKDMAKKMIEACTFYLKNRPDHYYGFCFWVTSFLFSYATAAGWSPRLWVYTVGISREEFGLQHWYTEGVYVAKYGQNARRRNFVRALRKALKEKLKENYFE